MHNFPTYEKSVRSIEGDEVAEQVADRHNQLKELVETEHLGEQLAQKWNLVITFDGGVR